MRLQKMTHLQVNKSSKKETTEKATSYGKIKETTIGGLVMSRSYRHINNYEKETLETRQQK